MSARDQMIASIITVLAVFAIAWGAWWLLRRCRYLGWLMEEVPGPVREPATRPLTLGDLVTHPCGERPADPDPALGCRFCGLPYDPQADCTCPDPCRDPQCGARAWLAAGDAEEWKP
jgi:hypothetical protein